MNDDKLVSDIKRHEGEVKQHGRHVVYKDSVGIETIGWGRNLQTGISEGEAEMLLRTDIAMCIKQASHFNWFHALDGVRKEAIISMIFNLGIGRFKKFRKMIGWLSQGVYKKAAAEAKDSKWYTQVHGRSKEIVYMLKTGQYLVP